MESQRENALPKVTQKHLEEQELLMVPSTFPTTFVFGNITLSPNWS